MAVTVTVDMTVNVAMTMTVTPTHKVTTLKDAYLQQRSKGVQYDPDSLPYFKFIPK